MGTRQLSHRSITATALWCAWTAVSAPGLEAQGQSPPSMLMRPSSVSRCIDVSGLGSCLLRSPTTIAGQAAADGTPTPSRFTLQRGPPPHRSTLLAGGISLATGFVGIHGTGSFYSDNSRHGRRHLTIGFVTLGTMIGYAIRCSGVFACQGKLERNVFRAAFLTYAFNYVWSIGAAMNDAVAFNRRVGEAWSISFAPQIKSLAPPLPTPLPVKSSTDARIGLQLFRMAW